MDQGDHETPRLSRRDLLQWASACSSLLAAVACGGGGGGDADPAPAPAPGPIPAPTPSPGPPAPPAPGPPPPPPDEPIAANLGAITPQNQAATFRNINRLVATRDAPRGTTVQPLPPHARSLIALRYTHGGDTWTVQEYMARWRNAGLLVLKNGEVALESYGMGNTASSRWCSFSVAKSLTATLVGAALHDGSLDSIDRRVETLVPQFAGTPYAGSTIRHLLRMCSGIRWTEDAANPASDLGQLSAMVTAGQKGAPMQLMRTRPRDWPTATRFNYSTGESFVLGAAVIAATGVPLASYLSQKIWARIGMEADAYWTLDGKDGMELGGASFSATLRDYGRFGLLVLRDGVFAGQRILPEGWRDRAGRHETALTAPGAVWGDYPLGYGYKWWTFPNSTVFEAQGLYGQHIIIHPAENVVVVVWNAWLQPGNYQAEKETWSLFSGIVDALR